MRIKALLVSATVIGSCLFSAAFAAENGAATLFDVNESESSAGGRTLCVQIKNVPQNSGYDTLYVLKSETALDDGIITADEASTGVFFGESTNKGGNFDFKFRINDADSGIYTMISGGNTPGGNLKSRSIKFWYNSEGLKNEKLSALNANVTAENLEAGNRDEWYMDFTNPAYLNAKEAIVSIINAVKPETGYRNQFELEEAFGFACDVINSDDVDSEKIAAYAKNRNDRIGFDFTNADYVQYSDDVLQRLKTVLDGKRENSEIKNMEDVRAAFIEACAIVCIDKTVDYSKVIGNLKRYNDIFKLDFTTKLPYLDDYEVAKAFIDTNYTSVAEIVNDYNGRVDELYAIYTNSNKGNGGGGGGSKGGGSTLTPSVINPGDIDKITGANNGFTDVSSEHWAHSYIQFVKDNKIMQGYEDGCFRPDDNISREEWVKTVLTAFVIDTTDAVCAFADVTTDRWSYPYIAKAFEMIIINGISDSLFAPMQNISRQDAAVMFCRAARAAREGALSDIAISNFTDAAEIADYAMEPINMLYRLEIVNGYDDGTFRPNAPITRAEAAKIIYTALDKLG